ncbi:MAG: SH3 domain-containing protein, partial [Clostridia bacterium]|nr:SH3 domain-containing protein [Clostridia bacterium]
NYVNVREKADSSSKILGNLRRGEEVSVISVGEKWVKIAYKDGTGYVFGEYVSSAKPDYAVVGKTATIVNAEDGVNIRAKASSSSKILGVAYNGDTFTVQGLSGRWVKVEYNGDSAYIYDSYIKIG